MSRHKQYQKTEEQIREQAKKNREGAWKSYLRLKKKQDKARAI